MDDQVARVASLAVGIVYARIADRAPCRACGAPTVGPGLVAICPMVEACIRDALLQLGIARSQRAVTIDQAAAADRAPRAHAASTVDAGLTFILSAIRTPR